MDTAASGAATSPDRARAAPSAKPRPLRKVQIVYYLCRNGQLEHPHFMEVAHHSSQQLRLKDVMDRLTFLRGKGMPSLFSWSCKRSYKNGFVWNDLAENDVIQPADGAAEYILKGSEIIEGCSEGFRRLQLGGGNRGKLLRAENQRRIFSRARPSELVLDDDASRRRPLPRRRPPSRRRSPASQGGDPPACRRGTTTPNTAEEPPPAQQQQPRSSGSSLQLIACRLLRRGEGSAATEDVGACSASAGLCSPGRERAALQRSSLQATAAAPAHCRLRMAENTGPPPPCLKIFFLHERTATAARRGGKERRWKCIPEGRKRTSLGRAGW
ncbi:unnamed protein product [Spirodela intermedia]|uniref:SOSEKI DIX-like domain-containing protein n=1 Tax=Spirodela intermedia TaxID=51605 RepID=A0A7I8IR98_SPIIN|nr:unnamed protein product [Spirodela intermedia]CAA6659471.1 unnamed protein product [Spirodela intermedia]